MTAVAEVLDTESEVLVVDNAESEDVNTDETETQPTDDDIARLFDAGASDSESVPNAFGFTSAESPSHDTEEPVVEIRPKRGRKRRALGKSSDPVLEEMFTEAGVGAVVTSGLDAFFRFCQAMPMDDKEKKQSEKIVAYYCQQRMPKEASKYQPEILLGLMLSFLVIPRLGPIVTKTAPAVEPLLTRAWNGTRNMFRRVFGRRDAE